MENEASAKWQNISRTISIVTFLFGLISFQSSAFAHANEELDNRSKTGFEVPNITFLDLNGNRKNLSEYMFQPVIIHFWASWCSNCVKELSDIGHFAEQHGNVTILTVDEDKALTSNVVIMRRNLLGSVVQFTDPGRIASDALQIDDLPTTIFVKADGRMVRRREGTLRWETSILSVFSENANSH